MVANSTVMQTAYTLSLALAILSALHLYWAFGGSWGLAAALGREQIEPTAALRIAAGAVATALAVAVAGVLGRVGVWGRFLPWLLFSWEMWALVTALFLAAVINLTARTWLERMLFAPIALVLGMLALSIARSTRP